MNRLQKKCFIGAGGMHLLLLTILFVGPAFLTAERVDDSPVLEIMPDIATDRDAKGGGEKSTPAPPTPARPIQPPQQPVQPRRADPPPRVEPQKVEPQKVEKVDKVEPVKDNKTAPDALEARTDKKQPHKVQVSDTVVKIKDRKPNPSTATSTSQAEAKAAAERSRQLANAANAIRGGISQTTSVEITSTGGFGGGGPSYANYNQVVRKIYYDAWNAWSVPDSVNDDQASVQVSVTIARNGQVISSRILSSSGSRAVVEAAQKVLDRVSYVKEFPAGAKDTERTFTMTFKLNAKTSTG